MSDAWLAIVSSWLHRATAMDNPLLPALLAQQVWLSIAWTLVLAWAFVALTLWFGGSKRFAWSAATLVALSGFLPVTYTPAYWLGLAFQAPSITTACLCLLGAFRLLTSNGQRVNSSTTNRALLILGVFTGWLLLLDTLALLPGVQLYAWGFSPAAPAIVVLLVVLFGGINGERKAPLLLSTLGLLVFMTLHLPSGNVWDAVIDPWLWLALNFIGLRALIRR